MVTDIHEGRTASTAEALRAEFGDRIGSFVYDVADCDRADEILEQVARQWGPVDILVNNAAENVLAPIAEYQVSDWKRGIDVNLTGCFYLIQRALPAMMEKGWGSIVNVTSVAAWLAGRGQVASAACRCSRWRMSWPGLSPPSSIPTRISRRHRRCPIALRAPGNISVVQSRICITIGVPIRLSDPARRSSVSRMQRSSPAWVTMATSTPSS